VFDVVFKQAASLHDVVARVVDSGTVVVHGTDKREFVGVAGGAREDLGDLDAGNVGLDGPERAADFAGRGGLHVEGVQLRRTAHHHQHDAGGVCLLEIHSAQRGNAGSQAEKRASIETIQP
jgi:hypothetical protein